jgi:hypothetical protein
MTDRSPSPCPSCGAVLAADQRYCLHCGARAAEPRVDPLRDMGVHAPRRAAAPGGGRRRRWPLATGEGGRRPIGLAAGALAVAAGVVLGWLSGPAPGVASLAAAPNRVVLLDQPVAAPTAVVATPTAAPTPEPVDTPAPTPAQTATAAPTAATAAATAAPTEAAPVAAVTATATPTPAPPPAIQHVWVADVPDVNSGYPAELKASGTLLSGFAPVDPDPLAEDVALLSGQAPPAQASYPADVLTLPGQLATAGLTWQAYVADPAQGCPPVFAAFQSLGATCAPHALTALATDPPTALDWLAVPDDATLRAVVAPVLASPAYTAGGLVVLSAPDGALLLSPLVAAGVTVAATTGPYALLRTLEDAFGLLHLGHAADADVAALGSDVFPTPTP